MAKEEDELLLANLDQEWAEMRAQMDYTKGAQDGGDGDDNNEDDFEKIARALSTQVCWRRSRFVNAPKHVPRHLKLRPIVSLQRKKLHSRPKNVSKNSRRLHRVLCLTNML